MNKNCSKCVYQDGIRADGTFRCCTLERQRDETVTDCCIPVAPLRQLQDRSLTVDQYIFNTQNYISTQKSQSSYWSKQLKSNG
jgi:hypothetical protein